MIFKGDPFEKVHTALFHIHLADAFIQSDLQLHSGYTFSVVYVFPGNRTHNLLRCWRNALPLSHTGTNIMASFTRNPGLCRRIQISFACLHIQTYLHVRTSIWHLISNLMCLVFSCKFKYAQTQIKSRVVQWGRTFVGQAGTYSSFTLVSLTKRI